ncbi:cilia- and flagella-associated protein 53 isoform X1 [Syngnathus scovelli]|uniref:cilia- and flagella-associated protein 53 isoform X1 n=1 Tax=Syngnathus scovelli TaxID=161590 RepID=UPI002110CDA7|nr:cilia- and flagella-associated protein 53 isoform X1 [Syngnathus scovelli]XP_049593719.1 cilia- and flagella-associated protein 53 isoform X1 [Syngnathus scovelli]XP_049593721.1 cilia- and flagella-associated protein 53 isoform X1 [Syngnathus scovelli]XP_049593722.1 cilia- and flagella-associated protein 53 isoform X1 [Syngnathus scovelli]
MLPARRAMLLRQRQEEERQRASECAREREACRVNNRWLLTSEARNAGHSVRRDVDDVMMQHRCAVHQRQQRLRQLLEDEERQLVLSARQARETPSERQAQMRERAKSLHDAREAQRRQVVALKLDQQFREQCQELRQAQSKQRFLQVCEERAAQLRSQRELALARQREDDMFQQLWRADAHAKEERERCEATRARRCDQMQTEFLRQQLDDAESQRQSRRRDRQEQARQQVLQTWPSSCGRSGPQSAHVTCCLQEEQTQALQRQAQRERGLRHQGQAARRRLLDDSLRLKMERVAKEQQDELQLDLDILRQTLQDESQAQRDTADKRADLRDEQLRFRQYLADQTAARQKDEEEMEQMMGEKMKETWDRRERQNRLQQDARNRLMREVAESHQLQNAQKQQREVQRRADIAKERMEVDAALQDTKQADEELSKRQRRAYVAYQAELQAQVEQLRRQRREREDEERREQRHLEQLEQEKLERKDRVLARPNDGIMHPFRKAAGAQEQRPKALASPGHSPRH